MVIEQDNGVSRRSGDWCSSIAGGPGVAKLTTASPYPAEPGPQASQRVERGGRLGVFEHSVMIRPPVSCALTKEASLVEL